METFSALLVICAGNSHRPPVNSPHKGQWRGALIFSLICSWINGWANNRDAGDLRRLRFNYDVTVIEVKLIKYPFVAAHHRLRGSNQRGIIMLWHPSYMCRYFSIFQDVIDICVGLSSASLSVLAFIRWSWTSSCKTKFTSHRPLQMWKYGLSGVRGVHDDLIKWKHFLCYWPFVRGIHRSPVNSPHKGQWRGALMFSSICGLNKRLRKQTWGWWFETPSIVIIAGQLVVFIYTHIWTIKCPPTRY